MRPKGYKVPPYTQKTTQFIIFSPEGGDNTPKVSNESPPSFLLLGASSDDQPSAFFGGDFSRSFSSDLGFSGDLDFRTAFFSLSAVLEAAHFFRVSKHVALPLLWMTYLTLFSTDFSLVGGLLMGLLVLITLPWCCSFPALLYLFLLGLGAPYFLRI